MSMAQRMPAKTMKCAHCGQLFKGNPRSQPLGSNDYCSISCEEGRGPLPMSDPGSDGYHVFLQGEPEELVGHTLVARGLKRVDYSADWCKNPDDWGRSIIVSHDEHDVSYIRKDDVIVGRVVDMEDGEYIIRLKRTSFDDDPVETETVEKRHSVTAVVDLIRTERWWVDA